MCSHLGPGRFLGELRPDLPEGCQEDAAGLGMLKPNQPCTEALTALLASGGAEKPQRDAQQQGGKRKSSIPGLGWLWRHFALMRTKAQTGWPWWHCASCDTHRVTAPARVGALCVHSEPPQWVRKLWEARWESSPLLLLWTLRETLMRPSGFSVPENQTLRLGSLLGQPAPTEAVSAGNPTAFL